MRRLFLLLSSILVITSCAPGDDTGANVLDESWVVVVDTDKTVSVGSRPAPIIIYLIRDDNVVSRPRLVTRDLTPDTIFAELSNPPTANELALGFRTSLLGSSLIFSDWYLNGDVVEIFLTENFSTLSSPEQRLALAQIVLSLHKNLPITGVQFVYGDSNFAVPNAAGEVVERPLVANDYSELIE